MFGPSAATAAVALLAAIGAGPVPVPVQHVPTTTTLAVATARDGTTTLTVTVKAADRVPTGTVMVCLGPELLADLPLDAHGGASLTTGRLADVAHILTAEFTSTGTLTGSISPPVTVGRPLRGAAGVTVEIPAGSLTMTRRSGDIALTDGRGPGASGRAGVTVTDTRAGNLGFTVSTQVTVAKLGGPLHQVLVRDVEATQVPANALQADDVLVPTGIRRLRPGGAVLATYPSGIGVGSVEVQATVVALGLTRGVDHLRISWTVV